MFGHWKKGKPHGKMLTIWKDGKKVFDTYVDGERTGKTTFQTRTGQQYVANYQNDRMVGID